ncbi:MAG TPA: class I SAM-dependent methyltransferase, partial [Polyangia bacterium]|nr:class I SAM-dependent methyltransferase [Polyangia bacterium]
SHGQLTAVAYSDPAPLLAEPLLDVIERLGPALVRAKGFVHVAGDPRRGFLERAGLHTEHVEGFQQDYSETLRHWQERLDTHLEEAERLAGAERLRVWRLYLRAARHGFDVGYTKVYQALARLPAHTYTPGAARRGTSRTLQ